MRQVPESGMSGMFLYLIKSKPGTSYTRTYLLMRKQCLMFMLLLAASTADYFCTSDATYTRTYLFMSLLAASERAEKNPLKPTFRKDIVESYKPIV